MFKAVTGEAFYQSPSFKVALFAIILSFVLSTVLALIYHITNRGSAFSRNFFQSMVMSSTVTCMVIMAVGDNIAAGFGVIGAIAIIRFRMRIENPRNIIFIFASLAVGIAAGVHGYAIAFAGTLMFCTISLMLYMSPYGAKILASEFNLRFTMAKSVDKKTIENFLLNNCSGFRMLAVESSKRGDRFDYFVTLQGHIDKEVFYNTLSAMEGISGVRLDRSDNLERI